MDKKFPISEELTYKSNKQKIKLKNWGRFLAIIYFLNDFQFFSQVSREGEDENGNGTDQSNRNNANKN